MRRPQKDAFPKAGIRMVDGPPILREWHAMMSLPSNRINPLRAEAKTNDMVRDGANRRDGSRPVWAGVLTAFALSLGGCATLPNNGPTAGGVVRGIAEEKSGLAIELVDIDASTPEVHDATLGQRAVERFSLPAYQDWSQRISPIAAGDALQISIFEVGVTLFGGQLDFGGAAGADAAPTAKNVALPPMQVDPQGMIQLPYIGKIKVAGLTPEEAQQVIQRRMAPLSQQPQVLVAVADSLHNSVQIFGTVKVPGRIRLMPTGERLLDVVARAGGSVEPSVDTVVRVTRAQVTSQIRLSSVEAGGPSDIQLMPGDSIELIKDPQTFSVFGATSTVSQVPFNVASLSLAEAIARAGGPNESQADASAVFVFRLDRGNQDSALTPVVYRLNLLRPESYFLGQRFAMKDKDLIYFANARANLPTKFLNVINQLFAPVVTARVLANTN